MSDQLVILLNGESQLQYDRSKPLLGQQRGFLEKMDKELQREITINNKKIDHPDLKQRAQFVALNLIQAILNSEEQKAAAMGAKDTNVAKPWRAEVYLVLRPPPHPVLRHELAHVVIGAKAPGPFAMAGRFDGWVPNPGMVEGIAVAVEETRGDLTVHQWAAAMSKAELLPRLGHLFGFGFFTKHAGTAYTAAGSFTAWVREIFGPKALQDRSHANCQGKTLNNEDVRLLGKLPFLHELCGRISWPRHESSESCLDGRLVRRRAVHRAVFRLGAAGPTRSRNDKADGDSGTYSAHLRDNCFHLDREANRWLELSSGIMSMTLVSSTYHRRTVQVG